MRAALMFVRDPMMTSSYVVTSPWRQLWMISDVLAISSHNSTVQAVGTGWTIGAARLFCRCFYKKDLKTNEDTDTKRIRMFFWWIRTDNQPKISRIETRRGHTAVRVTSCGSNVFPITYTWFLTAFLIRYHSNNLQCQQSLVLTRTTRCLTSYCHCFNHNVTTVHRCLWLRAIFIRSLQSRRDSWHQLGLLAGV